MSSFLTLVQHIRIMARSVPILLALIATLSSYCKRRNMMIVRTVHFITVCISMTTPGKLIMRKEYKKRRSRWF